MSKTELKPCPFCGGTVRLQITDGEGNWKDKSYLEYPYSGIGYVLVHDTNNSEYECPIATYAEDETSLGRWMYNSEKSAEEAWNRRVCNE